jgi:hypothetical protein
MVIDRGRARRRVKRGLAARLVAHDGAIMRVGGWPRVSSAALWYADRESRLALSTPFELRLLRHERDPRDWRRKGRALWRLGVIVVAIYMGAGAGALVQRTTAAHPH